MSEQQNPLESGPENGQGSRQGRDRGMPVWILSLDTSGCGACTQSVYALQAPRHAAAMRAGGVTFARSPRHAQVVLLTGALCAAACASVARLLDAVPEPRVLVAVGDCAIDGCVFRGSPELDASLAETLDVHVEIPGCPPTPEAILDAIAEARRLLMGEALAADQTVDETETAGRAAAGDDMNDDASNEEAVAESPTGEPADEVDTPAVERGDAEEGGAQA
jgi:Ni,Fe-hydrogenase III small subunit